MTVWAVNIDKHDTSAAAVWGDIRHINTRYVYGDEIENERMPNDTLDALRRAAWEFDPQRDFVLICGDHLQLVAFVHAIASCRPGVKVHFLRYDKKVAGYIPVWV